MTSLVAAMPLPHRPTTVASLLQTLAPDLSLGRLCKQNILEHLLGWIYCREGLT